MYFTSKSRQNARPKSVKWITLASSPRQRLSLEDGETRDKKWHSFQSAFSEYFKLARSEDVNNEKNSDLAR